jgi:hypothetical protein
MMAATVTSSVARAMLVSSLARMARFSASVVRRVSSERRHSEIGYMMEALALRYCCP